MWTIQYMQVNHVMLLLQKRRMPSCNVEYKTQEVDTLALHSTPEASAAALFLAVGSTP